MKRKVALLLVIALVIALATPMPYASARRAMKHATNRAVTPTTASATLTSTGDTTVTGTALLDFNPRTGRTTVTLTVRGLAPGSSHAAHIHASSCDGPIVFPLKNVVANQAGVGVSKSVIRSRINVTNWWVNVHRDPTIPSPGITCGKVGLRTVIRVLAASAFLEPTGDSTATGCAMLDFHPRMGVTMVTLLVKGLTPGSSHAAHIHASSCDGPIVFPLNNVVVNSSGVGFSRTVIKSRIYTSNWWVNVHRDAMIPSPGITCGQVKANIVVREVLR